MRVCNKCRTELFGDNIAFEGQVLDWYNLRDLQLCDECIFEFVPILSKFLGIEIKPAELVERDDLPKKKKRSKAMEDLIASKETIC